MSNILEIQGLNKKYPNFELKDIGFSVPKGYIMGFIGPNGAGKTTTIKAILNMIKIDSGKIKILGHDDFQRIGVVMDSPFYVKDWKVKDVESAIAPFYNDWNGSKYKSMTEKFGISSDKKVSELSRGMKLKLMLAAAFSHGAEFLILDEPTSGLDPLARDELMDILLDFISSENRSVLFSTHITSDLEKIADYITFINNGKIVYTGTKDDLMEYYSLVKGGRNELSAEQKNKIIGLRNHSLGFEGMIKTSDARSFFKDCHLEPVKLEEIIIFMNKGGAEYE